MNEELAQAFLTFLRKFPSIFLSGGKKYTKPREYRTVNFRSGTYDYQQQGIREEGALTISRHNPHISVQLLKKTTKPPKHGIR
jgi:hypothetical protein